MPTLIGLDWDERTAFEVANKGWYGAASLMMDDGRSIPLNVWDPVRLGQEVQAEFARGKSFFAENHVIILPCITETAIRQAVEQLIQEGFFEPIA